MSQIKYEGSELDLFAAVHNWKTYWAASIRQSIRGDVLEAGAGIGSNYPYLCAGHSGRWVCLEPDPKLVDQLRQNIVATDAAHPAEVVCGTLADIPADQQFHTIVYIDVLEHIEHDRDELERAASHLKPDGRVIVLSPAHQSLYTPFDKAIGHFRRYNRASLKAATPPSLVLEKLYYLDAAGLFLSAGNRLFLRSAMPTKQQLSFWDNWVIPISRIVDPLLLHAAGKTIIGVWQLKNA